MKLFSWVQDKLNGRQSTNCNTNIYASTKNERQECGGEKEEFNDWPQGFLSIGTLFTKSLKEDRNEKSEKGIIDLTIEEVKELQEELRTLISSNHIDCFSSFQASNKEAGDEEEEDQPFHQQFETIVTNNKHKKMFIGNKSLSLLLKKMFICGFSGSLAPTPALRDPTLSAPPKTSTRFSKILRVMLRKKIYPQNSCSNMWSKKYLGMSGRMKSSNYDDEDGFDTQQNCSSKWDKSDTEYIVLEI